MPSLRRGFLFLSLLAFVLVPGRARATAVTVNGACEFGNCAYPGVLRNGALSGHFQVDYTFANTDRYLLVGAYLLTNAGGTSFSFGVATEAEFLGNSFGTTSGNDVLTVDFFQGFENALTAASFSSCLTGDFAGGAAPDSSYTYQFIVAGNALPLLGPFYPPGSFYGTSSLYVTGLNRELSQELTQVFSFGAGSAVGANIDLGVPPGPFNVTPEPASLMLLSAGLLGFSGFRGLRRRKRHL